MQQASSEECTRIWAGAGYVAVNHQCLMLENHRCVEILFSLAWKVSRVCHSSGST